MLKLPDKSSFQYKEGTIGGDLCWLITPNAFNVDWSDDNLIYRSLIIRQSDNFVVSCGFKKFFNLNEKPYIDPFPEGKFKSFEKKDGSLLIVSKYKGILVNRTRGTFDATNLDNGHEIEFLLSKYPTIEKHFNNADTYDYSLLFEWQTPSNIIVIDEVAEPTLTFLGMIHHGNNDDEFCGKYENDQKLLNELAEVLNIPRPIEYHYNSIKECVEDVTLWHDKEGVVISSMDGQSLRKIKADHYCKLHSLLSGYSTPEKILDIFLDVDMIHSTFDDFFGYIENTLDYEIANRNVDNIRNIVNAYQKYLEIKNKINITIQTNWSGLSRKEQADEILRRWSSWKSTVAFCLLSNDKPVQKKTIKIAILELLESQ